MACALSSGTAAFCDLPDSSVKECPAAFHAQLTPMRHSSICLLQGDSVSYRLMTCMQHIDLLLHHQHCLYARTATFLWSSKHTCGPLT